MNGFALVALRALAHDLKLVITEEDLVKTITQTTQLDIMARLEEAILRVRLANAEGNPILGAWLPEAEQALRQARKESQFAKYVNRGKYLRRVKSAKGGRNEN